MTHTTMVKCDRCGTSAKADPYVVTVGWASLRFVRALSGTEIQLGQRGLDDIEADLCGACCEGVRKALAAAMQPEVAE